MQDINRLFGSGRFTLFVSLKTIDQLLPRNGESLRYAEALPKLPNYIVGTIGDQVGTIGSLAGTFGDAKKNEELQHKIHKLTKKGVDIRDRQIIIDSYLGGMDIFLTNDRDLCSVNSANRIKEELGLQIMSPPSLLSFLARA